MTTTTPMMMTIFIVDYEYFYDVELPQHIPKLTLKTNDECQQTKSVCDIYELKRCSRDKIYFTSNNLGLLTRLDPYTTTETLTLFYYNLLTHHVWLAKEDTHQPCYLQEQLFSSKQLQFQLVNRIIATHPLSIYQPL